MKNNIKNLLREKGISIRQMSLDLDKNYAYMHHLVNKDSLEATQLSTLLEVAKYLDVEITDLYG